MRSYFKLYQFTAGDTGCPIFNDQRQGAPVAAVMQNKNGALQYLSQAYFFAQFAQVWALTQATIDAGPPITPDFFTTGSGLYQMFWNGAFNVIPYADHMKS